MIYFSKYAEQKFEILNRHKVYITKEDVKNAILEPDKLEKRKTRQSATKDGLRVVFSVQGEVKKILTFYPLKK